MTYNTQLAQFAAAVKIRDRLRDILGPTPSWHLDAETFEAFVRALKLASFRVRELQVGPRLAVCQ
jgi:hypothetical protein